jgi:hypothetical protein
MLARPCSTRSRRLALKEDGSLVKNMFYPILLCGVAPSLKSSSKRGK